MTEQAERPVNLKGESRGVDKCGPKWPARGPETRIDGGLESSNSALLQHFSRVERVTGIEPALSAWEADVLPLNYTRMAPTGIPHRRGRQSNGRGRSASAHLG